MTTFSSMIGKIMATVEVNDDKDQMTFTDTDGTRYIFYHEGDCCETVEIESVEGELDDLLVFPILMAEQVSSEGVADRSPGLGDDSYDSSFTWTFYKFATIRGTVVVRWYGSSNGYYSEEVDFAIRAAGDNRAV